MSLLRAPLNAWLRYSEKPVLKKTDDPLAIRRRFEKKSKIYFHAPLGTRETLMTLGGRPALRVRPPRTRTDNLILYFHGGGFVFGSPRTHAPMVTSLARRCRSQAILADYRKAPEHLFPKAVDDAEAAYLDLSSKLAPEKIVLGGDSSGGGLALSLLARLIARGHALPAGVFCLSPLTDLTFSGKSFHENAQSEVILPAERAEELTALYLGDQDPKHPEASPLFADFSGAPPIWLRAGSTEFLRDDTVRMAEHLTAQGVEVDMRIEHDLPHVWPMFHNVLPEARQTQTEASEWIKSRWRSSTDS